MTFYTILELAISQLENAVLPTLLSCLSAEQSASKGCAAAIHQNLLVSLLNKRFLGWRKFNSGPNWLKFGQKAFHTYVMAWLNGHWEIRKKNFVRPCYCCHCAHCFTKILKTVKEERARKISRVRNSQAGI